MFQGISNLGARSLKLWSRGVSTSTLVNATASLSGRKAVITGGSDGIGAEVAKDFLKMGMKVAVVARNESKFLKLMEQDTFRANAHNIVFIPGDLTDTASTVLAAERAVEWAGGHVHVLVNNAGIVVEDTLIDASVDDWNRQFAVNVRSPFLFARAVSGGMIDNKCGKIINISSQASMLSLHKHGIYSSTKAALDGMTRAMASELSCHNVQVNSVAPTVVMTDMGRKVWGQGDDKAQRMLDCLPLGRFAEIEEITSMVSYLASDASNIIAGQTLCCDGGVSTVGLHIRKRDVDAAETEVAA